MDLPSSKNHCSSCDSAPGATAESIAAAESSQTSEDVPGQRKRPYTAPQLAESRPAALLDRVRQKATAGSASAQFMLGYAFEAGIGGPPDLAAALNCYRKAALKAAKAER